jgi:hypothetical protein
LVHYEKKQQKMDWKKIQNIKFKKFKKMGKMDKNTPLVVESSWWSLKLWLAHGKGRGSTILTKEIKLEHCEKSNVKRMLAQQERQCEKNNMIKMTMWKKSAIKVTMWKE